MHVLLAQTAADLQITTSCRHGTLVHDGVRLAAVDVYAAYRDWLIAAFGQAPTGQHLRVPS